MPVLSRLALYAQPELPRNPTSPVCSGSNQLCSDKAHTSIAPRASQDRPPACSCSCSRSGGWDWTDGFAAFPRSQHTDYCGSSGQKLYVCLRHPHTLPLAVPITNLLLLLLSAFYLIAVAVFLFSSDKTTLAEFLAETGSRPFDRWAFHTSWGSFSLKESDKKAF